MGLTIHYNLRSTARSCETARELVARLRGRAMDLPLERVDDTIELRGAACDFNQYDREHPNRWLLIQARQSVDDPHCQGYSYTVTPQHMIAFSTWPGEGCEEANFGLCRYPASIEVNLPKFGRNRRVPTGLRGWSWHSFCKTQYASNPECGGLRHFLRCHLAVIAMLDQARSLGILEHASDEGEFWEKRDVEALAREVGQWNQMIAGWAGKLKDVLGNDVFSAITEFPDFEHLEAKGRRRE
jgi:hypothetical protein